MLDLRAKLVHLELQVRMDVQGPLARREPEVNRESWGSQDRRAQQARLAKLVRKVYWELQGSEGCQVKTVRQEPRDHQDHLDRPAREENKDLQAPLGSRACPDPLAPQVKVANPVTREFLVKPEPLV